MIVDHILDTAAILMSACEKRLSAGAEELCICVTHGLFTRQQWQNVWSLPVQNIFCTDAIPASPTIQDSRITVPSVAHGLREKLTQACSGVRVASALLSGGVTCSVLLPLKSPDPGPVPPYFRVLQQRKLKW